MSRTTRAGPPRASPWLASDDPRPLDREPTWRCGPLRRSVDRPRSRSWTGRVRPTRRPFSRPERHTCLGYGGSERRSDMQALVLERKDEIGLRDFPVEERLGPRDVRIALRTVGVCGSDVHYYTHGAIGPFVVKEPMILGHEAAGEVVEVGPAVTELKVGDRVCMEPGIPDPASRATRLGKYNLDPAVRFWATPPVHGVLRPTGVHPADFTFKLPDNVSYAEGAMVEPLAVGVHGTVKARVTPGDVAVVVGAGPIGMVTVLAALAAGCSRVIVSDIHEPKLAMARTLGPVISVNVKNQNLLEVV